MSLRKTAYMWDVRMLGHRPSSRLHAEHPRRLEVLAPDQLKESVPGLVCPVVQEHGEQWVLQVHTEQYIRSLRTAFDDGIRQLDTSPTYVSVDTFEVAKVAVSAVLTGVDEVFEDRADNAFCAVRPPGHHANQHRALGFCLINNVAVAARYVQQQYRRRRVMIVDWDVHPGNGTMEIFYDDQTVLTVSLHQADLMPGTGSVELRGKGDAENTTINIPLPRSMDPDLYCARFADAVVTAADRFRPDAILIAAGFDTHAADPIGNMRLQDHHYATLTAAMLTLADRYCDGKLVSILEGGYHPDILRRAVVTHCQALRVR